MQRFVAVVYTCLVGYQWSWRWRRAARDLFAPLLPTPCDGMGGHLCYTIAVLLALGMVGIGSWYGGIADAPEPHGPRPHPGLATLTACGGGPPRARRPPHRRAAVVAQRGRRQRHRRAAGRAAPAVRHRSPHPVGPRVGRRAGTRWKRKPQPRWKPAPPSSAWAAACRSTSWGRKAIRLLGKARSARHT